MSIEEKSTKDIILESAVDLFAVNGFHGTSMRQLARKVGIKESSLYHHFLNKDDIMDEILNYQISSFNTSTPTLEVVMEISRGTKEPVKFWLAVLDEFLKRVPPLMEKTTQILANEMYLNEKCRRFVTHTLFDAQKKLTEMSLRFMNESGMIRKCDFEIVAEQYVYMLYGLETENRLRALNGESDENLKRNLIKNVSFFIANLS